MDIWEKYKAWGERNRIANEKTEQQVYGDLAPIMRQFMEGFGPGGLAGITRRPGFLWKNFLTKLASRDLTEEELTVLRNIADQERALGISRMRIDNQGRRMERLWEHIKETYGDRGVMDKYDIWDMKGKSVKEIKEMMKDSDLSDWEIPYLKNTLDDYFQLYKEYDNLTGQHADIDQIIYRLEQYLK